MNQIFRDHLPFILGGLAVTAGMLAVRHQAKWGKRLSKAVFILACVYPCAITGLFLGRKQMGESYAYLIFGDIAAMLLAIFAAIIVLAWIPVYAVGVRRKKEK
jgi:hypothetical protein